MSIIRLMGIYGKKTGVDQERLLEILDQIERHTSDDDSKLGVVLKDIEEEEYEWRDRQFLQDATIVGTPHGLIRYGVALCRVAVSETAGGTFELIQPGMLKSQSNTLWKLGQIREDLKFEFEDSSKGWIGSAIFLVAILLIFGLIMIGLYNR